MFNKLMHKIVKWLDPKLEKYRTKKHTPKPYPYTPTTLQDFIAILQRTPRSILSDKDRDRIAAIMNFDDRRVEHLMVHKKSMIFVNENDFLGPLMLDKLYKSGFTNFPVTDSKGKVKGIIHTEALNALEIKKTDRASKYIDQNVNFLHTTDPLQFAIEEIERTNSYYFLVLDKDDNLVGFFTIQLLLDYLLGQ